MSHDLSFNNDGNAELVLGSGVSAWHALGTVFPSLVTKDQAIAIAMPWSAESFELLLPSRQVLEKTGIQITTNKTGRLAILRSDTAKTIGFVGEGYEVLQPSKMFDFMEGIHVQGYETAGALKGGSVLFLTAPVGEINVLGSGDITKTYLNFLNSFDGSIAAQVHMSGVRIVCRNTMNMSLSSADGKTLKFKHTKSLHARMSQAQSIMSAQALTEESLKNALETLAIRKLKKQTYEDILTDLFPGEHTRTKNVKTTVTELFADNDNNAFPDFKGTAYNLYNAITNYADHERDIRITKASANEDITLQRYESALIGTGAELKMRALERILVLSDGSEVLESSPYTSLPPKNITPRYKSTSQDTDQTDQAGSTPANVWHDATPQGYGPIESTDSDSDSDSPSDYDGSTFDSNYVAYEDRPENAPHYTREGEQDQAGSTDQAVQDNGLQALVGTPDTPQDQGDHGPSSDQGEEQDQAVYMDLFTTAPVTCDLPGTHEREIAEIVSDSVKVRRVETPDSLVLAQIDAYSQAGYFVAGAEKWSQLQASKK